MSDGNPSIAPAENEPPRELNRLEVLKGLRIATQEAAYATVWASLTTGAFLTGFALWLGANSFAIGLLTAIPTFAGLIQIVSSYFSERLRTRKPLVAWFSLAGRSLWFVILLLPLFLHGSIVVIPFLFLFALSYVLINVPLPAYLSWMSDLVPPDHRGRYFGRRNMIAGIVGMVIGLPAAWFLDYTTKQTHQELLGFGTLFAIGGIGGIISFTLLLRQPEPPRRTAPPPAEKPTLLKGVTTYYRAPFADRNFTRLLLFNVVFGLGQFFAAPFFTVWALQNLHLNYTALQICATLTSLASLASMPLWGYLSDRFGNKPLLAIGAFGTCTLPLYWIFTSPSNPVMMYALIFMVNITGGFFWAGVGLTQFNLLISFSPPEKTAVYVATMSAVTGLTGGLAPLLGGLMMKAAEGVSFPVLNLLMQNYHLTFFTAALLRLIGLLFLRPVEDVKASSTRDVLQQLSRANPRDWKFIRDLQRGTGEESKLRATEALGESRSQLAVAELQRALTDPSPGVRAEAAHALGEIGDPGTLESLLAALHDPSAGLVIEAAHALGRIGDRRANSALIGLLEEGDWLSLAEKQEIARALGKLGGMDAGEALLEALTNTEEEQFAETVVRALGMIGNNRAVPALVLKLTMAQSRALQLAIIRALGEVGDARALPALRERFARSADAVLLPTLADALARLDDIDALPALLNALSRQSFSIARKQIANAIGSLLKESDSLYPLLAREEFARDTAVSRLLEEMRKRNGGPVANALEPALHYYVEGDYEDCLATLTAAAHPLLSQSELSPSPAVTLLSLLSESPPQAVGVETVLLALVALRSVLKEDDSAVSSPFASPANT